MKKCIISFANSRGNYVKSLARLSESLRNNFDGDFLAFVGEQSIGAPLHSENPYAFKIYAWYEAIRQGYTHILWLDSSCFAIKNTKPIFDKIDQQGYIMQEAGHLAGTWTNDNALAYFGISRDQAMKMPCYGNAGFLGLKINDPWPNHFFTTWAHSMDAGMFKGAWTNEDHSQSPDERCKGHRHDMSCGSIIANDLGMKYESGQSWLQYGGVFDEVLNDSIIIKAQGL